MNLPTIEQILASEATETVLTIVSSLTNEQFNQVFAIMERMNMVRELQVVADLQVVTVETIELNWE